MRGFPARLIMVLGAILATGAAGCTRSDRGRAEDTSGSAVAGSVDSGMAGMDHSKMASTDRPPAKDADQEFLRMMSDHHQGLIDMASVAMNKASTEEGKGDAHRLHTKQEQEQRQILDMLGSAYGETLKPMTMANNKTMNDALQQKSGREYDETFYRMVVQHHREGVQMIDRLLPRLTRPDVRQMAERMRGDQQQEIQVFEQKRARVAATASSVAAPREGKLSWS